MGRVTRACVAVAVLLSLVAAGCSDAARDARPGSGRAGSASSQPAEPSGSASAASSPSSQPGGRAPALRSADARVPAGTCQGSTCTPVGLARWIAVPYTPPVPCSADGTTCRLRLEVTAPASGGPYPLVVLLAGGPSAPTGQGYAAAGDLPLAAGGAVVVRAAWRQGAEYGGGWPASLHDIACAVGVARRLAPRYGADPGHVTLVGHSLGGWLAVVAGLTRAPFTPPTGTCGRRAGSVRPDAVVSLAGALDQVRNQGLGPDFLNPFFGGSPVERPAAWAAGDPLALAERPAGRRAPPFTLVRGGQDTVVTASAAPALHGALRRSGYRSRLVEAPAADHNGVLVAPRAVAAVHAAAAASSRTA